MERFGNDKLFAGSIPELYESFLVPLIFEPYAADLANFTARRTGISTGSARLCSRTA